MARAKSIVIVVDDDPTILDVIVQMVEAIDPNLEAVGFSGHEVLRDERIFKASLFIIDIKLGDIDGRELAMNMPQACRSTPFLFISGVPFTEKELDSFASFLTVDFIAKPFGAKVLNNRIKILLAVSGQARRYLFEEDTDEKNIDYYTFVPFVAVVIDKDVNIKFANGQLRYLLGMESSAELFNRCLLDFIPKENKEKVKNDYMSILERLKSADDDYIESSCDIIASGGLIKTMKWGNVLFQGGPDQEKMVLSISSIEAFASPLMRKKRSYWQNQIIMHRAAIKDIRRKFKAEKDSTGLKNLCKPGILTNDP